MRLLGFSEIAFLLRLRQSGFRGNSQFRVRYRYFNQTEKKVLSIKYFANIHQAIQTKCQTTLQLVIKSSKDMTRYTLARSTSLRALAEALAAFVAIQVKSLFQYFHLSQFKLELIHASRICSKVISKAGFVFTCCFLSARVTQTN